MYVVSYAGHLYGPFETANDAASFAVRKARITAPWTIIRIRAALEDTEANFELEIKG